MQCAVIGSPIRHSLSPAMHRAAYAELGLDWTYEAVEVTEDGLREFLGALGDDVRGLSVTAPLKRRLAELIETQSDDVMRLGVANTLILEDGSPMLHNTDVPGAVNALHEQGLASITSARIIGGGATSASLAYALSTMGVDDIECVVRDPSRVVSVSGVHVSVHHIDEPLLDKVDLLVSTVPSDAIGSRSHELVEASRAVFDVVYDPWPTAIATAAAQGELPFVSGIDLLAHQAALQVELMTGSSVSPQVLRDAALVGLSAR